MAPCPPSVALRGLLDGTLSDAQAGQIRTHVRVCSACQTVLDELCDDPALRQWLPRKPTPPAGPALARVLEALQTAPPPVAGDTPSEIPASDQEAHRRPTSECWLAELGHYVVEGELGRGGMGIVLRARDTSLGRTVALKVLRPELADGTARLRLVREARLASRLKHPNVVTVHAVVDAPEGLPYLVMEYVEGQTLASLIRVGQRLEAREAAELLVQAADGLAAAHAVGLIHRDIKPSNIMVEGATGRAKVMDFGLARSGDSPGDLTREGALSGTPAYMSPEQARGTAGVDGRADVYGLGATLYEALTGEAPFHGAPHMVLQQVLGEEPRPPRQLNDRLPCDLETICLTAMAKEAARRYPTATALADDLRRWQRGEPIQARPAGKLERGWRWCRRNPRVAGLGLALVLVILTGFAGVTWQWRRAQAEASEASRHLREARQVVDHYLTAVSEDPELKTHNLDPLRRKLLSMARDYYQAFVREHADDPDLQAELGRAYGRLGTITAALDAPSRSLESFEHKREVFERLCRQHPDNAAYHNELAKAYWQLGCGLHCAGNKRAAWDALSHAQRLWQALSERYPAEPEYVARLVRTLNSLGRSYTIHGRLSQAEQAFDAGRAVYARWTAWQPAGPQLQESYGWLVANLGSLDRRTDRRADAPRLLNDAIDLARHLTQAHPREASYQDLLRHALTELGVVYSAMGEAEPAERTLAQALTAAERLLHDHPDSAEYQSDVAEILQNQAQVVYDLRNRPVEARGLFAQALAIQEKLVTAYPGCAPYRAWLMGTVGLLGELQRENGQPSAALALYNRVIRAWGKQRTAHRQELQRLYTERALSLTYLERYQRALADYDRALRQYKGCEQPHIQWLRELAAAGLLRSQGHLHQAADRVQSVVRQARCDGPVLYLAARFLAECTARARPADPRCEGYGTAAVAALRQARVAGYFHLSRRQARYAQDPAFNSLRRRDDFLALLAERSE